MQLPDIYSSTGLPGESDAADEFALDTKRWFESAMRDPHELFARIPLFSRIKSYTISMLTSLVGHRVLRENGRGYALVDGCPTCLQRQLRIAMRQYGSRINMYFTQTWAMAREQQNLKNQIVSYFCEKYPEIVDENKRIVYVTSDGPMTERKIFLL